MKISNFIRAGLVVAALAGCSTLQPGKPVVVECPPPEPPEPTVCPVCEVPSCPEPQTRIVEKVVTVPAELPPMATTAGKMHLPIVGAVEWATVEPVNLALEARIDTGAETSAIHAEDIQMVEKDGKRYVRFNLVNPENKEKIGMEERVRRKVLIKQPDAEPDRRYVVELWISLGELRSLVEVTLSDRLDYEYPLLIGRNFLVDAVIVDVSRHHTLAH
ncbi:MAG: RimK/LysX family protein [Halioglobus sp.]